MLSSSVVISPGLRWPAGGIRLHGNWIASGTNITSSHGGGDLDPLSAQEQAQASLVQGAHRATGAPFQTHRANMLSITHTHNFFSRTTTHFEIPGLVINMTLISPTHFAPTNITARLSSQHDLHLTIHCQLRTCLIT